MTPEPDSAVLVDRVADQRLLVEDPAKLPAEVGRPEAIPSLAARGRIVGLGATLTGVTLISGIALTALGTIEAVSGGAGLLGILAIAIGAILVGTHWGWVHVAEATADAFERRRNAAVVARRQQWLQTIEPYTRYEIRTGVADDGSITIDRVEHRPVPRGERVFTFEQRTERVAVYPGDGAAATVAEHAEQFRQQTAAETERERKRFEAAADRRERALLVQSDQHQQAEVRRAASEALSEQINSHLRDPPLG
jgi:hypothetical protein